MGLTIGVAPCDQRTLSMVATDGENCVCSMNVIWPAQARTAIVQDALFLDTLLSALAAAWAPLSLYCLPCA